MEMFYFYEIEMYLNESLIELIANAVQKKMGRRKCWLTGNATVYENVKYIYILYFPIDLLRFWC